MPPSWHSGHATPSHLYQPVLWPEPGVVRGGSWVQGADVLSGPGSVTVEVEAVARVRAHQVAQTRSELGRGGWGPWLGLGLGFSLGESLLEENENKSLTQVQNKHAQKQRFIHYYSMMTNHGKKIAEEHPVEMGSFSALGSSLKIQPNISALFKRYRNGAAYVENPGKTVWHCLQGILTQQVTSTPAEALYPFITTTFQASDSIIREMWGPLQRTHEYCQVKRWYTRFGNLKAVWNCFKTFLPDSHQEDAKRCLIVVS